MNYSVGGRKSTKLCARYAEDGMVDAPNKVRTQIGKLHQANKRATAWMAVKLRILAPNTLKMDGMVNISSKKRGYKGCISRPTYGVDGSKTA